MAWPTRALQFWTHPRGQHRRLRTRKASWPASIRLRWVFPAVCQAMQSLMAQVQWIAASYLGCFQQQETSLKKALSLGHVLATDLCSVLQTLPWASINQTDVYGAVLPPLVFGAGAYVHGPMRGLQDGVPTRSSWTPMHYTLLCHGVVTAL